MKDPVTPLVAAAMLAIAAASFPAQPEAGGRTGVGAADRGGALHLPGLQLLPAGRRGAGRAESASDILPLLPRHLLGSAWLVGHLRPRGEHRAAADLRRGLDRGGLYTPQMVIGGRIDVVGSQRGRVREAIDLLATRRQPGLPIAIEESAAARRRPRRDATIWLFGVRPRARGLDPARREPRPRHPLSQCRARGHHPRPLVGRSRGAGLAAPAPGSRRARQRGGGGPATGHGRDPGGSRIERPRPLAGAQPIRLGSPAASSRWIGVRWRE